MAARWLPLRWRGVSASAFGGSENSPGNAYVWPGISGGKGGARVLEAVMRGKLWRCGGLLALVLINPGNGAAVTADSGVTTQAPAPVEVRSAADGAAPQVADPVRELHQQGQYLQAAAAGMRQLAAQPWNHQLRFLVADSLQRAGRAQEALQQFRALAGTPLADMARLRATTLCSNPNPAPSCALAGRADDRPGAIPVVAAVPAAASSRREAIHLAQMHGGAVVADAGYAGLDRVPAAATLATPSRPPKPPRRQYLREALNEAPAPAEAPLRSTALQQVEALYAEERYAAAGSEGLAALRRNQVDDAVRLKIANSLAWSGRLPEAAQQYRTLLGSAQGNEARIGLANVQRWDGRADLALPLYREVLAQDPGNQDALEGMEQSARDVRPKTRATFDRSNDSSQVEQRSLRVAHRWRDRSLRHLFEVETGGANVAQSAVESMQRDLTLRYQSLALPLQPQFHVTAQSRPDSEVYGGARVRLGDRAAYLTIERVNWGNVSPSARSQWWHLAANHVGLEGKNGFALGEVRARLDYYDISDGNGISNGSVTWTPSWRPLGASLKPFASIEARDARFNTPNYWSPADGHGTFNLGVQGDWESADWNLYAVGQAGRRAFGEAGESWSVAAGGRRWLDDEWQVGVNLWRMSSWRENSGYRANALTFNLEKLWR